ILAGIGGSMVNLGLAFAGPLSNKAAAVPSLDRTNLVWLPIVSKFSISLRTGWATGTAWPVLLRPVCSCPRCYDALNGPAFDPFRLLLISLAGWLNQHKQDVIDYLQEENHVLREQLGGKRLRFNNDQRRRLAVGPRNWAGACCMN